jgi:hypothetical protein
VRFRGIESGKGNRVRYCSIVIPATLGGVRPSSKLFFLVRGTPHPIIVFPAVIGVPPSRHIDVGLESPTYGVFHDIIVVVTLKLQAPASQRPAGMSSTTSSKNAARERVALAMARLAEFQQNDRLLEHRLELPRRVQDQLWTHLRHYLHAVLGVSWLVNSTPGFSALLAFRGGNNRCRFPSKNPPAFPDLTHPFRTPWPGCSIGSRRRSPNSVTMRSSSRRAWLIESEDDCGRMKDER